MILGLAEAAASHVELEGCISVFVTAEVMARKGSHATRDGLLAGFWSAGVIDLGGLLNLDDRRSIDRFTDIVFMVVIGRAVR